MVDAKFKTHLKLFEFFDNSQDEDEDEDGDDDGYDDGYDDDEGGSVILALVFMTDSTSSIEVVDVTNDDEEIFDDIIFGPLDDHYAGDEVSIHDHIASIGDVSGYLFTEHGYRGECNYTGLLKVQGTWYIADLVSEGTIQPLKVSDKMVHKLVNKLKASMLDQT